MDAIDATPKGDFKHLGTVSNEPITQLDLIPWDGKSIEIDLDCSEFSSHCPVTDQPDYGRIRINYRPLNSLVETKSLKLYLYSFRNVRAFNEGIVNQIADDFAAQVKPQRVVVTGYFNQRGGISLTAEATRSA